MVQNSTKSILFTFDKYNEIYTNNINLKIYIMVNFDLLKTKSSLIMLNFFLSQKDYNFFFACLHPVVNFFYLSKLFLIDEFINFNLKK